MVGLVMAFSCTAFPVMMLEIYVRSFCRSRIINPYAGSAGFTKSGVMSWNDAPSHRQSPAFRSLDTPVRGVLHGAMALYLTRYLNVPPTRISGDAGERLDDLPADVDEIRSALLDAFDRQRQVDLAARLVARHLKLGHPPEALICHSVVLFGALPDLSVS